jgi:RHS repeat-associated protein
VRGEADAARSLPMKKYKIAVLDDYQNAALEGADWSALGNHTADNSYDPSGTLHRTHTRLFNTLSQLYQDVNAAGTSAVTTTYGYDANGNQTSIDAPLGRNTISIYDALNRLDQITDPNTGITKFVYDADNNLASVLDPRSLTTSYTHDGFNEVTKLVSPNSGTSSSTYDSAGNLKTTTDARGAVATYAYDALNRMTQVAYTDETINYTYDAGTDGKGRLTGASDANHSMSWTYNAQGRTTGKGQTVASVTKSVGYGYTNDDLTSIVTPSGQTITYTYTNHRVTSIKVNSTTLLSSVTYDPFGLATGWTWGNSTTVSRTYTEDGNPNQIVTAGVTNTYTEDNASRITGISDSGLSSNTFTFAYDLLDRVTSGTSSALNHGYTYDANGNRLTETGTLAYAAKITTTDNQIATTTGGLARTYGYDKAGNTTSYTGAAFTFNDRGRMSTAVTSGGTTTYIYNALGQLIEKSGNGGTTLLVYDESGHLLGEYSSTGVLIQETVWLGDVPVATLRPNGSSITIYYVHADHLGTPRKITNPTGNTVVWRWDPDTFGTSAPSVTTLAYNLRFPGQYYLSESGLYYNYLRDYDPQTGRYIESDPAGLRGGSFSTYAYARVSPLRFADPLGLCALIQQNGNNVQIQIPINYVGASPAQIQAYNSAIQSMWTGQFGQYNVTTIVTNPDPAAALNQINTVNVVPGSANANPGAWVDGGDLGTFVGPAVDANPVIAAHEAGHFMGLPDDYTAAIDPFGNRVTTPLPGFGNDIMATLNGLPSLQDIQQILNGPDGFSVPWGKSPEDQSPCP